MAAQTLYRLTLDGETIAVHTSEADVVAAVESYDRLGFRGLDVVPVPVLDVVD